MIAWLSPVIKPVALFPEVVDTPNNICVTVAPFAVACPTSEMSQSPGVSVIDVRSPYAVVAGKFVALVSDALTYAPIGDALL